MKKAFNALILLFSPLLAAESVPEFSLQLKDNLFYPSRIQVPADRKVKLVIHNHDATPEEFESFDLNREKVIFGGRKGVVYIGPLPPGEYQFFGEFHPNTARGTVVVVPEEAARAH